jgi:hypothetical protein
MPEIPGLKFISVRVGGRGGAQNLFRVEAQ